MTDMHVMQMFEGTYSPPFYTDLYNFKDGAQNDIFQNAYVSSLGPSATANARREVPVAAPTPNPRVVKKHKRTMALAGHGSF